MEELVNSRAAEIEISGIRKFYNLVSKYENVISLTIGQPDFNTPEHIKNAAINAILNNKTSYTHNAGLVELREEVCNYLQNKYNLSYSAENEVIVTCGASQAIDIALRTILTEGCEVILPAPVYPGYEPIIRLCGAVPIFVDTSSNSFVLSAELIAEHITSKTRCIILPYPSNPTGVVLSKEELNKIADLLKGKNIFILSDEIYSEIIYNGRHTSIGEYNCVKDKTIIINGLSKSHSMTGWRIGFLFAPAYLSKHMLKIHQYNVTCASSISQYAALEAVKNGFEDPYEMRKEFEKRRNFIYKGLCDIGFDVVKPEGAFYIFPSVKKYGLKSSDFAFRLLDETKVAVVPGDAFSKYGEGYVRVSYACSMDALQEGLNRINKFIKSII